MRATILSVILLLAVTFSHQACPSGWRQSTVDATKCYLVMVSKGIWFEAGASCAQQAPGATLTSITSAYMVYEINAVVTDTHSISNCDSLWIGANDFDQNGVFTWTDNKPFQYANWGAGQPDLSNQCVSSQARSTGKWKTEPCGTENCFICEVYTGSSGSTASTPSTTMRTSTTTSPTTTSTRTTTTSRTSTTSRTTTSTSPFSTSSSRLMTDCYDWLTYGHATTSGVYPIEPPGSRPFDVYCDMTTNGGGWTVFQRRTDASLSFYDRTWNEYKNGFSAGPAGNHWLGNDKIHLLSTKDRTVHLRIDIHGDRCQSGSFPGVCANQPERNGYWYGEYTFYIDSEANQYMMHTSDIISGTLSSPGSEGFRNSSGRPFATQDNDQGISIIQSQQLGAWWFNPGIFCALNGKYNADNGNWGMYYDRRFNTLDYDIVPVSTELKLRRVG